MSASQFNVDTKIVATELDCNGNADVSGTLAVTGAATFSSGVTVGGNIDFGDLDMARFGVGNDLQIFHNGTDNFIKNATSNQDLIIQGNDGGTIINALQLDMSQAGRAIFNEGIVAKTSTAGDFGLNLNTPAGDSMKLQVVDTGSAGAAHGLISVSDGDLTLDVAGDIKLDADSSNIYLADGGTDIGLLSTNNQDLNIRNLITDKDIYFQGKDGSSTITALTLDMSAAGEATFNDDINLHDGKRLRMGAGGDFEIFHDGSNNIFKGATSDQDMKFNGVDSGSEITALLLDMSAAGAATFNAGVTIGTNTRLASASGILFLNGPSATAFEVGAGSEKMRLTSSSFVINDASEDFDFRVESNGNANMLFVDGGNNSVNIGTNANSGFQLNVAGSTQTQNNLNVTSTGGANFTQGDVKISSSTIDTPAARGQGVFYFNEGVDRTWYSGTQYNSGGTFAIGYIAGTSLNTAAANPASASHLLTMYTGSVVVNEKSEDVDFRVESDANSNMLFVDGGNNRVGIGDNLTNGALTIGTSGVGSYNQITVTNTTAANVNKLAGLTTLNYAGDNVSVFQSFNQNNGTNTLYFGSADSSHRGYTTINTFLSSSNTATTNHRKIHTASYSSFVVNEDSADVDFRVESNDHEYKFFIDAANNNIGIGTANPDADVHIKQIGDIGNGNTQGLMLETGAGSQKYMLQCGRTGVANTYFNLRDVTNTRDIFSVIDTNGKFQGHTPFEWNNTAVFNENSQDYDFRVESNNDTHALFVDAANDRVIVGASASTAGTDFVSFDARPGATGQLIQCGRDSTSTKNQILFSNPNGAVGSIQTAGSGTAYNTSSDQRLKENIADADDAGSKIDAIQVRKFDWKADGEHQDYGMIAQELQTVAPEAVSQGEKEDDMWAVDYSKLVPMLIKEIQSLRNRVEQLENL
jgi:hypothetical protein